MGVRASAVHPAFCGKKVGAKLFLFGSHGSNFVGAEAVPSQRRGLQGEGLSRPTCFTGNVARRHGPFFQSKYGFAIAPVEYEHQPSLSDYGDRRNLFSFLHDVDQHWRGFQIVIPRVVMNRLKIPGQFSGVGMERNQRVAEKIFSLSVSGVKVRTGRAEGKKYKSS